MDYRLVTLWGNIAKIAATGIGASVAWGLVAWVLAVPTDAASLLGATVGVVSVLLAACRWDTHTITPEEPQA